MYKLGKGMFVASFVLLYAWMVWHFVQAGSVDEIIGLTITSLFIGGLSLVLINFTEDV